MKNKKLTYFLGFLVVVVWGLVIYRIVGAVRTVDDDSAPVSAPAAKEVYNDYAVPKDTTRLLLNYPDPFAVKKQKDTVALSTKKNVLTKPLTQPFKPAMNWSFIQYTGYVRNPGAKNLVALVSINGKSWMMVEGETEEQVKLLRNLQDSIQINYNGKTTYIKIRTGTL